MASGCGNGSTTGNGTGCCRKSFSWHGKAAAGVFRSFGTHQICHLLHGGHGLHCGSRWILLYFGKATENRQSLQKASLPGAWLRWILWFYCQSCFPLSTPCICHIFHMHGFKAQGKGVHYIYGYGVSGLLIGLGVGSHCQQFVNLPVRKPLQP